MKNNKNDTPETTTEMEPRVSLVLPFEKEMVKKEGLYKLLTEAADKLEIDLLKDYPEKKVGLVMNRLRNLIPGVKCPKREMSVCIFVSPITEKVYYFTNTTLHFPPSLKKSG